MCLIPTYFCDNCGHAFSTPEVKARGFSIFSGKDDEDRDERCPKCNNPDFELLTTDDEVERTTSDTTARREPSSSTYREAYGRSFQW